MSKPSTSDLILEATEAVIIRDGFAHFTIGAVAEQAGLSKGGVLHHFASKDALIRSLVVRCIDQCTENYRIAHDHAAPGPARYARAIIDYYLSDQKNWTDDRQTVSSAFLAALAANPALIEPIRVHSDEFRKHILCDEIPRGIGLVIVNAIDGLWLNWALGLERFDHERHTLLLTTLKELLEQAVNGQTDT
tara:strand:+ start:316 stop:888 length:573 start_codon:yes stop_codon:yes gene_type:complete